MTIHIMLIALLNACITTIRVAGSFVVPYEGVSSVQVKTTYRYKFEVPHIFTK